MSEGFRRQRVKVFALWDGPVHLGASSRPLEVQHHSCQEGGVVVKQPNGQVAVGAQYPSDASSLAAMVEILLPGTIKRDPADIAALRRFVDSLTFSWVQPHCSPLVSMTSSSRLHGMLKLPLEVVLRPLLEIGASPPQDAVPGLFRAR